MLKTIFNSIRAHAFPLLSIIVVLGLSITLIGTLYSKDKAIKKKAKNQQVIDELLINYKKAGGKNFNAKRGHDLWVKKVKVKGKLKSCVDCHGSDLAKPGKHNRSGKIIKPMAAWTEPSRYTKIKKIEKWFKRNCKSTWGRECTPQEKGDFLTYLRKPL